MCQATREKMSLETTLKIWTLPSSSTEQEKQERTEQMIRHRLWNVLLVTSTKRPAKQPLSERPITCQDAKFAIDLARCPVHSRGTFRSQT